MGQWASLNVADAAALTLNYSRLAASWRTIVFHAPATRCIVFAVSSLFALDAWAAPSHPPVRHTPPASQRALAEGRHYFIDPVNGDDTAAGSQQKPWRTIAQGVATLRAGDTLVLRGGVYYERLYVALVGAEGKPVTIRSFPGEQAIIDGSLREFFESPDKCWQPADGGAPGEYVSTKA
jgi:hypothetical protein